MTKQTAQDVLTLLERGTYEASDRTVSIGDVQRAAVEGSVLFTPSQLSEMLAAGASGSPPVRVVDGTTQVAAQAMSAEGPLALLNFASARNPGGGFLNGAKAQEEDLCRCSGLYPTLLGHPTYYDVNRAQRSMIYTDHAIYSPEVPFFRVKGTAELLDHPFLASVITMPAPNSAPHLKRNPGDTATLEQAFLRRWKQVLCIASDQGDTRVLLGAWGCGAFGGDPEMAARTARSALASHGGGLDEVVFAIPNRGRQSRHNFETFQAILE